MDCPRTYIHTHIHMPVYVYEWPDKRGKSESGIFCCDTRQCDRSRRFLVNYEQCEMAPVSFELVRALAVPPSVQFGHLGPEGRHLERISLKWEIPLVCAVLCWRRWGVCSTVVSSQSVRSTGLEGALWRPAAW